VIRLHLGCGARFLKGYMHVDLADFPHIDYRHEISVLPMFEDGSAELVYACHCFEYFDRQEAPRVLAEWRRVLRKGGVLRLAVPDFSALVKVYMRYGDLGRVIGPVFGRWPVPGTDTVIYHRTIYDFRSLAEMLRGSGFSGVRAWRPEDVFTGDNAGFDDYSQAYVPHMDRQNGICISLNIEAVRE